MHGCERELDLVQRRKEVTRYRENDENELIQFPSKKEISER